MALHGSHVKFRYSSKFSKKVNKRKMPAKFVSIGYSGFRVQDVHVG
jgi:hypothetical protein